MKKLKIILSGGGTAGHIHPAVATAEELTRQAGDGVEILFVGALGRMEMERIPSLGYKIVGLPVAGLQRRLALSNLLLPFKLWRSVREAKKIIRQFDADVVVGFGGYASAPVLRAAQAMGVPTLIQEQNSFAGLTNKILGAKARTICTAYEGMERFFPAERIVLTGNPLRGAFSRDGVERQQALQYFGFEEDVPTLLVVGGSLGTRTLNSMMMSWLKLQKRERIQIIWQSGRYYDGEVKEFLSAHNSDGVWQGAFIERMDYAYAAADVVISRSGACTVSELCLVAKPTIFVPSPNVAEDHQTRNAEALSKRGAALLVEDALCEAEAMELAIELLTDKARLEDMSRRIEAMAKPNAAKDIVAQIMKLTK